MYRSMLRTIVGALVCLFAVSFPLTAQELGTGRIGGTVVDPAGRAIANVVVTLTNATQGTTRTFTTQTDGVFSFSTLEAANYNVTAAAASSGFAA